MADFIQGDYEYTILDNTTNVRVNVWDNTKDTYETIPETIEYNNVTYTITSMMGCFWGCTSFNQSIVIPNSVTSMDNCFYGCTSFNQSIVIPNSVTTMNGCFNGCIRLNQPITLSNSVWDMNHCFYGCVLFNQPIVIPDSVTRMGNCFWGCTSFNQPIIIPDSVTDIGGCFGNCFSFNQLLIIPDSVTDMRTCFYRCTSFNQLIIIPESVTNMDSCFYGCTSFNQPIIIPESVTDIYRCFYGCTNLSSSITITTNSINDVRNCFYNTNNPRIIIANDASIRYWSELIPSETGGGTIASYIGTEYIGHYIYYPYYDSGVLAVMVSGNNSLEKYEPILKKIRCADGVLPIGIMDDCFNNCYNFNQSITIPETVTSAARCFKNCTSLSQNIIASYALDYISEFMFEGTSQPIYIKINLPINSNNYESVATYWRNVASRYSNVHFEADDHTAPRITLTATRGEYNNNNWEQSIDGNIIKLTSTWSILDDNLPYGSTPVNYNAYPSVYLDEQSTAIRSFNSGNEIYVDLSNLENVDPLIKHVFAASINDGYKTTTVTAIVTRAGALLDFLGNQNPRSPYVDIPGMGMAIGTLAIKNGLDIQFPTTIGEGLIPPTQPVSPEICENQDTTIDLDKNYYVFDSNKYYKVNIIKGTIEGTSTKKPFMLTKDSSPVTNKVYYTTEDKIEFTQISSITSNDKPAGSGWYEEDTRSPYDNNWYAATQEAVDLNNYQLTIGDYNLQDPGIQSMYGDVALIVGNGTDNLHRSNAFTIGKDGLVGAYIDYDTDAIRSTDSTGETEAQYLTRFAIINSNNNKVTYIDAHKWGSGQTLGVFGAQRMFYNNDGTTDTIQNQFGLGIKNDKSLFIFMSNDAVEAWNATLNADYVTSQGTSGIWRYRKWASGASECWGMKAATSYAITGSWGNGFYASTSVTYPSGLFTEAPTVSMCKGGAASGLQWLSISSNTATTLNIYVCDSRSGTYSFPISIQAKGRWK